MADSRSSFTVEPTLEELLPTPQTMEMFKQALAAFEAGRLVRGWRERAGLTQRQLADRLRLTQARISAIESGRGRDGPTYGLMQRLATACGVDWPTGIAIAAEADAPPQSGAIGHLPGELARLQRTFQFLRKNMQTFPTDTPPTTTAEATDQGYRGRGARGRNNLARGK